MTKKLLGERLVEAGLVTRQAIDEALQQQRITGHKLGECLVQLRLIDEQVLLRFLAAELKTRFVSTDKLAKVRVDVDILDKVPVRMCEAQHFVPIALDAARGQLSIVATDPNNPALLQEIALVSNVKEVVAYVGLRSAVHAAIKKLYYGDSAAFTAIEASASKSDLSGLHRAVDTKSDSRPNIAPLRFETDARMRAGSNGSARGGTSITGLTPLRDGLSIVRSSIGDNDYVETLNVLVGMLEQGRRELRGHSSQLARQASQVGRRLGMGPRELSHLAIAAHLHDLGKPADRHFTVASNAANPEWKADAKRYARAPVKLLEAVHLPPVVNLVLAQLYEAFDGSGAPGSAKGEDIALGARILAAVDVSLDLVKNPHNGLGRLFGRDEMLAHLREQSGKLYDPKVVAAIAHVYSGDLLRQRIQTDGRQILVADEEEGTRLQLTDALTRRGLFAHSMNDLEGAVEAALTGELDVLVLSLRYGARAVVQATEELKARPVTASLPMVVLGDSADQVSRGALMHAGVSEFIPLPLDADKAAQAIGALYRERIEYGSPARPVRGSFDELSQVELWRTLGAARKSGRISYRIDGREAQLYLEKGRVVGAVMGTQSGDTVIKALTSLSAAEFVYDPDGLWLDVPQLDVDLERLVATLEEKAA